MPVELESRLRKLAALRAPLAGNTLAIEALETIVMMSEEGMRRGGAETHAMMAEVLDRLLAHDPKQIVGPLIAAAERGREAARILTAARVAYHDPSCPPRDCDRCGRSYTGPAVYCSLTCALADA